MYFLTRTIRPSGVPIARWESPSVTLKFIFTPVPLLEKVISENAGSSEGKRMNQLNLTDDKICPQCISANL